MNLNISGKSWINITVFALILSLVSGLFSQDVFLKITTKGEDQINTAVLEFSTEGEVGTFTKHFTRILKMDLKYSLFINIIDSCSCSFQSIEKEDGIDYPCWANEKVQVLVWGRVKAKAKEEVEVELFVNSVAFRHRILKKSYQAKYRDIRRLAHTAAEDIIKQLTGENGVTTTKILFVSNRTGNKEIYITDYDGANTRQLTDFGSISLFPDISPDRSNIIFTSYYDGDITEGNPVNGSKLYRLELSDHSYEILTAFKGQNGPASFSPDGKKIALTLSKDGNSEIYIMDIAKKSLRRITYNWGIDTSPCWSPSGQKLAFTSDISGYPQIYTIDVDGANMKRLTFIGNYNDQPAWSPKGDKIAYCSMIDNRFNIVTIGLAGALPTLLTSEGDNQSPTWSPDGYYITFSSNRTGGYKLYQMDYQGGNIRCISHGGEDFDPVWTERYNWDFEK